MGLLVAVLSKAIVANSTGLFVVESIRIPVILPVPRTIGSASEGVAPTCGGTPAGPPIRDGREPAGAVKLSGRVLAGVTPKGSGAGDGVIVVSVEGVVGLLLAGVSVVWARETVALTMSKDNNRAFMRL